MIKIMTPHHYVVDGIPTVSIESHAPTTGEIAFVVGTDLHTFRLTRTALEKLGLLIASQLKTAPLPARGE